MKSGRCTLGMTLRVRTLHWNTIRTPAEPVVGLLRLLSVCGAKGGSGTGLHCEQCNETRDEGRVHGGVRDAANRQASPYLDRRPFRRCAHPTRMLLVGMDDSVRGYLHCLLVLSALKPRGMRYPHVTSSACKRKALLDANGRHPTYEGEHMVAGSRAQPSLGEKNCRRATCGATRAIEDGGSLPRADGSRVGDSRHPLPKRAHLEKCTSAQISSRGPHALPRATRCV